MFFYFNSEIFFYIKIEHPHCHMVSRSSIIHCHVHLPMHVWPSQTFNSQLSNYTSAQDHLLVWQSCSSCTVEKHESRKLSLTTCNMLIAKPQQRACSSKWVSMTRVQYISIHLGNAKTKRPIINHTGSSPENLLQGSTQKHLLVCIIALKKLISSFQML
jgi:hypothetical protein